MKIEEMVPGSVKVAMKDSGAGSSDLWSVPVEAIKEIPGFNVRVHNASYEEHIDNLSRLIEANGFRKDRALSGYVAKVDGANVIFITDGHSRLAAAKKAIARGVELKTLPVVVAPNGTSAEDMTVGLVTSNNGRPLESLELAEVCKRLVGFGWTQAEVSRRIGVSANYVAKLLSLIEAPREIRKMVETGKVSATLAMDTIAKKPEKALEVLRKAVDKAKVNGKGKATKANVGSKPINLHGTISARDDSNEGFTVYMVRVDGPRNDSITNGLAVKMTVKPASDDDL